MQSIYSFFTPLQWCFIGAVLGLFIVLSLYQILIYWRVALYKPKHPTAEVLAPSVSIVLCATNEYKHLKRILPLLLEQNYPLYEVVIVNDRSEDKSEMMLRSLQEQYAHLQVRTTSTDDRFGRSPALSLGVAIRAAQYDTILCIESHCNITNNQWIQSMVSSYGGAAEIVCGYTTHNTSSKLIRCDFLQHALHYMGRAAKGRAYMGLGSNLLFKKSLFYDNNGFNVRLTRNHFPDRVFINEVATHKNSGICAQPSGLTHSKIRFSFSEWRRYRKTEQNSFALNKRGPAHPMLLESIFRLLFYGGAIVALLIFRDLSLMIGFGVILLLRQISILLLYINIRKKLSEQGLLALFMIYDLLFPFINILSSFPRRYAAQQIGR